MELILFILFVIIIGGFLIFDLGFLDKNAHKIEQKSAIIQSIFWVILSTLFGGLVWIFVGHELAAQFFSAYLTEKMLSVDNLFVMMVIFSYFKLNEKYYHKALYWGIFGALLFRGIFITAGVALIHQFHWILYIFGGILIWTGIKLFKGGDDDDDFQENRLFKFVKQYFPVTTTPHDGRFFLKENGKWFVTMFFMIILLIETTDILFAFDSIPAVFAISQDWFIVFTSNIFAVMGLRAMFFVVENILRKFSRLQEGLACVLIFIGGKMFADIFGVHISSLASLGVILVTLAISLILSIKFPKEK